MGQAIAKKHRAKVKNPGKAERHGKSTEYYEKGGKKVAAPNPYTKKRRGMNIFQHGG